MSRLSTAFVLAFSMPLASTATAQCVWGSFDATRINYSGGVLTTGNHSTLRSLITTNGGKLAAATSTLTSTYLAGVNVFYTSLLKSTGSLSNTEQSALQSWVKAGGTMVVTGDIYSQAFYNGFTQFMGVTFGSKTSTACAAVAPTVTTHPVTLGVTKYYYCTNGIFSTSTGVTLLGNDSGANPFLAVVDASSTLQGRLVVLGDHNMFTDSYITKESNTRLATNIVKWACAGCTAKASWANYGTGLAGKSGVPTLVPSANPVHATTIRLLGSNSSGTASSGLITVGLTQTSVPFLGGTLLTGLDALLYLPVAATGIALPLSVPAFPTACGANVYCQLLQIDAAAAQGVSFTRGLRLTVGK